MPRFLVARSLLLASLLLGGACAQSSRTPCQGGSDTSTCGPGATCLWMQVGNESGYFCAIDCTGGAACPTGQACVAEAATSCQTCDNLLDVCE
jgi:hypothetical protein